MERLTHRYGPDGRAVPTEFDIGPIAGIQDDDIWSGFDALVNRLAAYEDTGLEPEDIVIIKAVYEPDHIKLKAYHAIGTVEELTALVKARDEGRVVLLPCKVGDVLYTASPVKGMVTSFEAPDLSWIVENIPQFGKTVFLTRAEAEAALSGGAKP